MSRTFRRKTSKRSYQNYKDVEEFNAIKALHDAGNPKPIPTPSSCGRFWNHNAIEWREYREALYFLLYSYGKATFEEWLAAEVANFHSDAGYGHHRHQTAPGWFVTRYCQRPFRSRCKQMMREALQTDSWDDMALPPYIRDAAWKYD